MASPDASSPSPPPPSTSDTSTSSDTAQRRKRALLAKISEFEQRGAILYADAHTLRTQVHDSTSGQWRAVETRLKQLAMSWNPYQDFSASDRHAQDKRERRAQRKHSVDEPAAPTDAAPASSASSAAPPVKRKQDFYELLQLDERECATSDAIKRQFRKLALQLHPDKQQQQQQAQALATAATDETEASTTATTDDASTDSTAAASDARGLDTATAFARLRLAYETLSDPTQRAAYDAKLQDQHAWSTLADDGTVVVGANQITLEASTDFASLEWIARVKHKMDVMDRIAEWATILVVPATELRFETGDACNGRQCGKIVTMDRDLECYGSPRRRVYVCLLHKYIHACDELCTSRYGDAERDKRVCPMRAYWLIQNWLFDQLQHATGDDESKDDSVDRPRALDATMIHLGDSHSTFAIANVALCTSATCGQRFQYLDDGIYACSAHGTPHICTYEQCDAKELRDGRYVCWCSGNRYGGYREDVGTGTRTRQIVYTDAHGDAAAIEMEVPVLLPLGQTTSHLLEGSGAKPRSSNDDVSSLSPPPPSEKAWHTTVQDNDAAMDDRSPRPRLKRRHSDRETSPVRARIRRRLREKVERSEVSSFYIHLKLPAAVADLPRVALELQDPTESLGTDSHDLFARHDKLLPIRVRANDTVNYIKFWMEELTDQQLSIWDQQILWGDTVIGDEGNVMVLEEHGIVDGCVLELRLHDDCPLLVSTWTDQTAASGIGSSAEYNTVMISKEAAEDLEDQHDEWTNVVAVEEEAFERSRWSRKRAKLHDTGALDHTEVLQLGADNVPRLVGVVPIDRRSATAAAGALMHATELQLMDPETRRPRKRSKQDEALRAIAASAQALKKR